MPRYIDADALYRDTEKKIEESNKYRMAVVDSDFLDLINDAFTEDVAPVDEIIEAVKQIICENTYPSFDKNGKPVNVWKAREGYDALDALKEKYKEV